MNNIQDAFNSYSNAQHERYDAFYNHADMDTYLATDEKVKQIKQDIFNLIMCGAPAGVDPALFAGCFNFQKLQCAIEDTALINVVKQYIKDNLHTGDYVNSFGLSCALYDNGFIDTKEYPYFGLFNSKVVRTVMPALVNGDILAYVHTTSRHDYSDEYMLNVPQLKCVRFAATANLYVVK